MTEHIYQLRDATDDEVYWCIGYFLTVEDAIAFTAEREKPNELCDYTEHEWLSQFTVHKHRVGGFSDFGVVVATITFTERYDEEKDEYVWDKKVEVIKS